MIVVGFLRWLNFCVYCRLMFFYMVLVVNRLVSDGLVLVFVGMLYSVM